MSIMLRKRDFEPIVDYQKEVGNFIDSLFNLSSFAGTLRDQKGFELDLSEDNANYYVESDLPGIDKENLKIEVKEGQLFIIAERKYEEEKKERKYYRMERSYGKITRSIPIPDDANVENIDAEFKDGVLKIKIQKKEQVVEQIKKIEIR